jgi:hypothetical protein
MSDIEHDKPDLAKVIEPPPPSLCSHSSTRVRSANPQNTSA